MPRPFSAADVDRIARLARLQLTAEERALFVGQLDAILRYVEQIQAVATAGVPAMAHAAAACAPLRDDVPQPSLAREDATGSAPAVDTGGHLFKVPRVLG